ncbi:hypothetical protein A3Q56_03759 [Intoshia linei]|uniref:Citrate synthase n=1 Tax=Intoshia linei TaxID=1819745 RepID=A0A177B2L5_9BILA|nr:hypothetical protein A3Q56_03759 [Intoshia linei]
MIVLLGEVGGTLEYEVIEKLKLKIIEKPLIAWCIGTCTDKLNSEVQFGHAGSLAHANYETATAKNEAFRAAGAIVPTTFDSLDVKIKEVYTELLNQKIIVESPEIPPPTVPMDYSWAQELGIIRKPASFTSTITDERGQELLYCGMPITEIIDKDMGLGGVLGLLWFQKRLPSYACKYLEMCLMLTADHGPAVSGAHNTIVCARAGKDLISCLCSGLLTIGEKFGGALNGAAKQFSNAFDTNLLPTEFVNQVRREGKLIMGIGHRVKSVNNPDKRVSILKDYVFKNFNSTELLEYAIKVEQVTTAKKSNLILNVDGCIAVTMVDLLRSCGCFTSEESQNYVQMGCLNSLFVLGRSIGFIGHFMDQRRLKQDLYRHPWDDITYVMPEVYEP